MEYTECRYYLLELSADEKSDDDEPEPRLICFDLTVSGDKDLTEAQLQALFEAADKQKLKQFEQTGGRRILRSLRLSKKQYEAAKLILSVEFRFALSGYLPLYLRLTVTAQNGVDTQVPVCVLVRPGKNDDTALEELRRKICTEADQILARNQEVCRAMGGSLASVESEWVTAEQAHALGEMVLYYFL